ncbi:MAG: hypothetical protein D6702_03595 [Planctomycetota bacterium]|nr:MAG: hypothetical protein D6702_03595 [Planctomycetota bacterium]
MSARDRILERIRAALAGVEAPPLPPVEPPPPGPGDLVAFRAAAEAVGAVFPATLAEALAGVETVACSDAPEVQAALAELAAAGGQAPRAFPGWEDRAALLAADAGLSCAQYGIAETGTLVLVGDEERHRLVSLVPPRHVCLLRRDRILPTLGSALARLGGADPAAMSRLVTFVTGPSRTADIELELVLGVHGPRELRILLIDPPDRPEAAGPKP